MWQIFKWYLYKSEEIIMSYVCVSWGFQKGARAEEGDIPPPCQPQIVRNRRFFKENWAIPIRGPYTMNTTDNNTDRPILVYDYVFWEWHLHYQYYCQ